MITQPETVTGHCLCGAVRFSVCGPFSEGYGCHCSQCRRQSGHFPVATCAARSDFELTETGTLSWFQSSDFARRGFCRNCGSVLFWDDGGDQISINAGSLNAPTGLKLTHHIFVADKGDYYEINDGLPCYAGLPEEGAGSV
ncbi:MAG: GFA family protein [Pseudomonadota bacterium]